MDCNWKNIVAASVVFQASLAWNDVFKKVLEKYSPVEKGGSTIMSNIIYAIVITILVILIMEMVTGVEQFITVGKVQKVCMKNGNTEVCTSYK